jgi:plasmid stability protein
MRNVTVSLEDDVADWARVWAAKHQSSMSRMLAELLKEKMESDESYVAAMEDYLSVKPIVLSAGDGQEHPYPSREAAHER